jgi:hypothetical protein
MMTKDSLLSVAVGCERVVPTEDLSEAVVPVAMMPVMLVAVMQVSVELVAVAAVSLAVAVPPFESTTIDGTD